MWIDWLEGFSGFGFWQIVIYTIVVTQITVAAVTIYLHRYGAHRSLELHPIVSHFFRFWLWLTTGMVTREWVAIHRKHHALCETEDDPHSPQVLSLRKVLLQGTELYRSAATKENVERYGAGLPDDWIERRLYTGRSTWGITLMMVINLSLFGVGGLTVWALQMMWIPLWGAGVINGVGHYFGYRNYECPDAAVNIVPWGVFIGGEELHNNHHTYPNSAKFSRKWWEFDIGWFHVYILRALGLAKVHSTGPVAHRDQNKEEIDADTAQGVMNDRFRVMDKFRKYVIKPMAVQEYANSAASRRETFKNAHTLLAREDSLHTEQDRNRIQDIINSSDSLGVVYRLQQNLKALWVKRSQNKEELLQAFKAWIEEAERTNIQRVLEFVEDLKSYSLPQVSSG